MTYKEHIEHLKSFIGFTLVKDLTEKDFEALEDLWKDYERQCVNANSYKEGLRTLQSDIKKYEDFDATIDCFEENEKYLKEVNKLREELHTCKNELCLHCGKYKNEHLGACKDCRWHNTKKVEVRNNETL